MDWITESVAIGNYLDARDEKMLREHGFRSAVSLDATLKKGDEDDLPYRAIASYNLVDGPGNDPRVFLHALDALVRLVDSAPPVLVQCHAGRSRSVILVAAYLMRLHGHDEDEALAEVERKREVAITQGIEGLLSHV